MNPWDALEGQGPQREAWKAFLRSGRLPHAMLLAGPRGIGKRAFARAAARDLLCFSPERESACGACPSCQAFDSGSHPDLKEAFPSNRRFYRVSRTAEHEDEISPLLDWLALTPALGTRKALILDAAEGLGREEAGQEAADSLLKVLEEPPPGTFLFLVTESASAVVPTVASRAWRLCFEPLDRKAFEKALAGRAKGQSDALWGISRGSPGEALRLLESGLLRRREKLAALQTLIPAKPTAKEAGAEGWTPSEIQRQEALDRLQMLASILRDRHPGIPPEERIHPDLDAGPSANPEEGIRAALDAMDALRANANLPLALEVFALRAGAR